MSLDVFRNTETGEEFDIKTKYVEREETVTVNVRKYLYQKGTRISDDDLAALGLEVYTYSDEELLEKQITGWYEANPDLETRVRQYKAYLDELGLAYSSTMDEISAAVDASETIEDATAYKLEVKSVYDAISTNLEFIGSETPLMDTYELLSSLITYLPEESNT